MTALTSFHRVPVSNSKPRVLPSVHGRRATQRRDATGWVRLAARTVAACTMVDDDELIGHDRARRCHAHPLEHEACQRDVRDFAKARSVRPGGGHCRPRQQRLRTVLRPSPRRDITPVGFVVQLRSGSPRDEPNRWAASLSKYTHALLNRPGTTARGAVMPSPRARSLPARCADFARGGGAFVRVAANGLHRLDTASDASQAMPVRATSTPVGFAHGRERRQRTPTTRTMPS